MTIDLQKIFDFLNSLGGMPKCGLVFIFCISLGFALKKSPWVHNSSIPSLVTLAGALLLPMLSDWQQSSLHSVRVFILTQALIGFITGCAAVLAYRIAIKPLLLKFGAKPEDLDTDPPWPKEDGSNVKPQTETKP
jgi:hypothetical protein